MADLIVIAILVVVVAAAGCYIYKAKKSGRKCIGCPDGGCCSGSCSGNDHSAERCSCGCGGTDQ